VLFTDSWGLIPCLGSHVLVLSSIFDSVLGMIKNDVYSTWEQGAPLSECSWLLSDPSV
jgi:hypothetical protein